MAWPLNIIKQITMKHTETGWNSADGLKIFARAWEPEGEIKAVLCLVHGIGEHTGRFEPVAEMLTKQGFVLFGADWRGHGRSEGKRGHVQSIEVVLDDTDLLLGIARNRYPGKPLFLYGQSLGAILVLYYGLVRKPLIHGIIATSPALHSSLDEQPVKIAIARILGSLFPSLTLHSGLNPEWLTRDKSIVQAYRDDPMVHYQISLGFGRILIGIRKWSIKNSSRFEAPLLLMHGTQDKIAYPSGSIEFAEPIGKKCTFIQWEDAYHELHNEPEKEEVMKTITLWILNHCSNYE